MFRAAMQKIPATQVVGVSFNIIGRRLRDRFFLLGEKFDFELLYDRMSDFILNCEDVSQIAIKSLSPNVVAVVGADEFTSHAHARTRFTHAAFENVIHPEIVRDLLHLYGFAFVSEKSVARDAEEPGDLREIGNDVLRNAIAK